MQKCCLLYTSSVPIYSGFEWWQGPFEVGKGSSIGFHNHIDCRIGVYIGKDVCLASNICIWSLHHDYNDIHFAAKGAPVRIEDYAWLCSHCIISVSYTHLGEKVRVIKGPLSGLVGELVTVGGKSKIAVRLNMLGCACVDMPIGYVEPTKITNDNTKKI